MLKTIAYHCPYQTFILEVRKLEVVYRDSRRRFDAWTHILLLFFFFFWNPYMILSTLSQIFFSIFFLLKVRRSFVIMKWRAPSRWLSRPSRCSGEHFILPDSSTVTLTRDPRELIVFSTHNMRVFFAKLIIIISKVPRNLMHPRRRHPTNHTLSVTH